MNCTFNRRSVDQLADAAQAIIMRFFKHRRAIGWLALVAMLGNLLVAFAPANIAAPGEHTLGPMPICSSSGAQIVPYEEDVPDPESPSGRHCLVCRLSQSVTFVVAELSTESSSRVQDVPRPRRDQAPRVTEQLCLGGVGSRAPPLAA
jgi:hypothetical protein